MAERRATFSTFSTLPHVGYHLSGTLLRIGLRPGADAWWVAQGSIGDIDVSGLVVVSVTGPSTSSGSAPRVFLIDERVAPEQLRLLLDAFEGRLGGPLAEVASPVSEELGYYQVPIRYSRDRSRESLIVSRRASLTIRPAVGTRPAALAPSPSRGLDLASVAASGRVRVIEHDLSFDVDELPAARGEFRFIWK
jgi:hypothetical protein